MARLRWTNSFRGRATRVGRVKHRSHPGCNSVTVVGPSTLCGGAVALEPPRGFEPLTYSLRAKRALRSPSHGFWADAWMASMVVHHCRPLALVIVTQFVTHRTTVASYPRPASPKACHYAIPSVSRQTTLT